MRLFPNKAQFSLKFMLRLIVYSSLIALCVRLYQQIRPANRAAALLRATDSWTNSAPHEYLTAMGPAAMPFLLREIEQGDELQQVRAMKVLELLPAEADRAVPVVLTRLKHHDSEVRATAARALGNIGRAEREIVLPLVEAIYDSDPWVWSEATESLYALAVSHEKRTIHSHADKDASNPFVRMKLCGALGSLGPLAARGEPWLIDALKDEAEMVRWSAAVALTRLGVTDRRAVAPLLEVYREPNPSFARLRWRVAVLLHSLGVDSVELVPVLTADLAHENAYTRLAAAEALWREFGQLEAGLSTVTELLAHDDREIRVLAAGLLSRIGPDARGATLGLLWASADPDDVVRSLAQLALESIGRRSGQ